MVVSSFRDYYYYYLRFEKKKEHIKKRGKRRQERGQISKYLIGNISSGMTHKVQQ